MRIKQIGRVLGQLLKDLPLLEHPTTAAAVVAVIVAVTGPFGLAIGTSATVMTGIVAATGVAAAAIESLVKTITADESRS